MRMLLSGLTTIENSKDISKKKKKNKCAHLCLLQCLGNNVGCGNNPNVQVWMNIHEVWQYRQWNIM